jgi:hypothetical protein
MVRLILASCSCSSAAYPLGPRRAGRPRSHHLLRQDSEAARQLCERAVGECPHSFIEYEMAPVELKRLLTKSALVQQPCAQ